MPPYARSDVQCPLSHTNISPDVETLPDDDDSSCIAVTPIIRREDRETVVRVMAKMARQWKWHQIQMHTTNDLLIYPFVGPSLG